MQGARPDPFTSPLMGAFFLKRPDERMAKSGLFYVRFMDDILVLSPTRWKLRRAVKAVNETLDALWLEKHPDKTFIGRIEKGFDFLGYHFSPDGLTVAKATIEKFLERAARLYEQERERPGGPSLFGLYVRRWVGWVRGGLTVGKGIHGDARSISPLHGMHEDIRTHCPNPSPAPPVPAMSA